MSNLEISRAERLDQYVVRQHPDMSRSFAVRLIEEGDVRVNGEPQLKAGYKVRTADRIVITHDPAKTVIFPEIELPIIYEDKNCVVINKPVGLLTHSKGAFNPEATVSTWLRGRMTAFKGERAGIVHRLDRATSGVMICAKTPEALSWLQKQFSQRKVKKTYVAIIEGVPKQTEAIIDMPIERNPKKPQTFRVGSNGKAAVTQYKVLKTKGAYSLLELRPTTGRTHQLRVHLKKLGHPIVGDTLYGGHPARRLFLHARELELTLPDKQRKVFQVPVPPEFEERLQGMKDLLIHPQVKRQLDSFIAEPPHAMLLIGPAGSGKRSLAIGLSEAILGLAPPRGFADYPYKLVITPGEGKSIGIEAVRELEHFLTLKVPAQTSHNRAVIIEDAQLLTTEAQNAILKTLEEPPQGAFVIISATSGQALLPTIRSRAQSLDVKQPGWAATEAYFKAKGFDDQPVRQAYAIGGGLPGLVQALLNETDHPLLAATQMARQLLSKPAYERLLLADELAKQRPLALDTVFILQQMAHVSLQTAAGPVAAKWQAVLTEAYGAAEALSANAQPKLVLTGLMLGL